MPELYKVSNSMRAKDRDGNPKVWESQYGTFEVWNVYFQNDDTKYQVNKKPGFQGFKRGQEVYGTTTKSTYGGQFKQEQMPDDMQTSAPRQSAPASGDLNDKVDYLIGLVEEIAERFQVSTDKPSKGTDTVLEDIDDKPIDLSDIPY